MPFKSEKQRRYLHINKPSIAKAWENKYGLGGLLDTKKIPKKKKGGGFDYEGDAYGTTSMSDYSSQDNEEQQAIDRQEFAAGRRSQSYRDMYGGGNGNKTKTKSVQTGGDNITTGSVSVGVPKNYLNYTSDLYTKEILGIGKKKEKPSLRQKLMKGYTVRTKASNLKELGVVDKKFDTVGGVPIGFAGALAEAFYVPKSTASFDKDSIREIASTKPNMTKAETKALADLKGDIAMEDKLKAGKVSQTEFNEYMNRNKPKNIGGDGDGGNQPIIPKPVVSTPVAEKVDPMKKIQLNFLKNFKSYDKGGLTRTVPPKRGPNPQVPPVKMRKGKMTKTYLNSCPHRPDGIRGMGKAIKGHKFVGTR